MENIKLIHGDCLKEMERLAEKGCKVDMILVDPPYESLLSEWANIILNSYKN